MKIKLPRPVGFDARLLEVRAHVRYPEDSDFIEFKTDDEGNEYKNYISDDADNPKIPCVESDPDIWGHQRFYWKPIIDIDNGRITNWEAGVNAHIFYKVCDEFECYLEDKDGHVILPYDGYVPRFMAIEEEGYGDYIDMIVDGNGFIKGWKFDFYSIDEIYNEEFWVV